MDETYIKVKGSWCYLYRAIDSSGVTLDIWLRKKRNHKRLGKQFGEPKILVTDKAPSLAYAFKQLQSEVLFITTTHRTIKKRHMFYRSIQTASSTIKGLETVHALYTKSRKEGNLFDFSIWNESN